MAKIIKLRKFLGEKQVAEMNRVQDRLKDLAKLKYTKEIIDAKDNQKKLRKALKKFKREHGEDTYLEMLKAFHLMNS